MMCGPGARVDIDNVEVPDTTGAVPRTEVPSLNATEPVVFALLVETVAIKMTLAPANDGLALDVRDVKVVAICTDWIKGLDVLP